MTPLNSKTITYEQLAKVIDHSLLRPELTEADVLAGCELADRYLRKSGSLFRPEAVRLKTLLILRHAKSSWKYDDLADHDRPLNNRGRRDAPRIGRLLAEKELLPDLIISSSARRARRTAELVAENSGCEGEIQLERDLYAAEPEAYRDALRRLGGDHRRVMVVGHNPGLEDLLEELTGDWERMPTAALAQVELPIDEWEQFDEEVEGRLVGFWRPKELPEG